MQADQHANTLAGALRTGRALQVPPLLRLQVTWHRHWTTLVLRGSVVAGLLWRGQDVDGWHDTPFFAPLFLLGCWFSSFF